MVIDVGEAKIRPVAHEGNFGVGASNLGDEGVRTIDAFLRASDQTNGPSVGDDGDFISRADLPFNLGQEGSVATKKGLMGFGAKSVPRCVCLGLPLGQLMNFPFDGNDPSRKERRLVKKKSFLQAGPRAARGDDPGDGGLFLGLEEPVKKIWG